MKKKCVFIVLGIILIVLTALFVIYLKYFNSKNFSKILFNKIATIDIDYVYNHFNIDDKIFITKDSIEQYLINLNINDKYIVNKVDVNSNNVTIDYLEKGSNKIKDFSFNIEKSNDLLNPWKISLSTFAVQNYHLFIPSKYKASLDGADLSSYKVADGEYLIPNILIGNHKLEITSDKTLTIQLDIDEDSNEFDYVETGSEELIDISYVEFMNLYKSDTKNVIILGSSTCSHCQSFIPVMEEASYKYNISVYYLDLTLLSSVQYNKIRELEYIKDNFIGTPFTILTYRSSVLNSISGYTTNVKSFFEGI